MTIIAVAGATMVADSASFQNDFMHPCIEPKIVRAPDGGLVGSCGAAGDGVFLRQWVRDGMDFKAPPKFSFTNATDDGSVLWLWLKPDGAVHMGDCTMMNWPVPKPVAIGQGAQYFHGLLDAGMAIEKAIEHIIRRVPYVGGDAQIERVGHRGVSVPLDVRHGETVQQAMDRRAGDTRWLT